MTFFLTYITFRVNIQAQEGRDTMSSFSDMLGYLRKRDGLSQKELAEKIRVSRSTIGMYEAGGREPNFETLEAIADIFNVNMDTLLGTPDCYTNSRPDSVPLPESISPSETQLLTLHRQLNDEGQSKLLSYADDLVSSGKYIK